MKILLIHPPPLSEDVLSDLLYPPLGLAYIAGALRENGHAVSIFDGNALGASTQEMTKFIEKYSPDLVGITSTTPNIFNAFAVADAVKSFDNEIKVVVGGVHPTVAPEHTLSNSNVDIVVVGEGDITICELVSALENGENIADVEGIAFKKDEGMVLTPKRKLIPNLDSLPFPVYDLLPIEKYSSLQSSKRHFMSMITSRGCPYRCIFCGVQTVFGYTYRANSPERTVNEIEYLIRNFNIEEILFKDSEFTLNTKRVEKICDLMIEKELGISWLCNGRVDHVTKEMLKKMKLAGCRVITYGVESGDQEILNTLKKQITLEDARKAFSMTKEVGIETVANFMVGNPGDTKETIEKTLAFAKELDPDYAQFNCITPFPGTELYKLAKKNEWLFEENLEKIKYDTCIMNATNLPTEELKKYASKMYRSFYFRPSYILKRLTKLRLRDLKSNISGLHSLLEYTIRKNR